MKTFTKSILMIAALGSFLTFASCGNSGAKAKALADSIAAAQTADSLAQIAAKAAAQTADSIAKATAAADSIAKAATTLKK